MASPAIQPSRTSGLLDPRQPGDYPIILGDSLKGDAKSADSFLNVRYNWQPRSGFIDGRESKMRQSGNRWHFDIPNRGPGTYQYVGQPSTQPGGSDEGTRSLALIFDESKAAFVLEAISTTLGMNLKVGPGMSKDSAQDLPQLPQGSPSAKENSKANGKAGNSFDDDTPDGSNPYDFRHFLAEARENMEKSNQVTGTRTPIHGSRTPMSGTSTPIPGGNRFLPTTPQFRPSQTKTATKSTEQRKKKTEAAPRNVKATTKPSAKRDTPKTSQPLSKATISDSDDSENETINFASAPVPKAAAPKPSRPLGGKSHTRNISANIGSSPHIIVNDDDGNLEIDMGSPPPEDDRSRRRGRVDPEAFRSRTGTPIGGLSSNIGRSISRPLSRTPALDESLPGRGRERDGDVRMKDIEAGSQQDEDEDVDDFDLDSPHGQTSVPREGHVSRDESDADERNDDRHPSTQDVEQNPPTPPAPNTSYGEDDEDFLEAALEAALEEESGNQPGVGLGIGIAKGDAQDDESEVSEEE